MERLKGVLGVLCGAHAVPGLEPAQAIKTVAASVSGLPPNNSFKPNLLRYIKSVA